MKTKVVFMGRHEFIRTLKSRGESLDNRYALISINDTNEEEELIHKNMSENNVSAECVSVVFQDTDDPFCINNEQAKSIVQFVADNEGKSFIVHCFAGVSRSAAVAMFINEYYDIQDPVLDNYSIYNKGVKNRIDAFSYRLSMYDYYTELELQDRIHDYDSK